MQVIRPIADSDLDTLVELAGATTFGLTTLRMDRDQLAHRISDSLHAFETLAGQPRGESYLFVLEDTDSGSVIGTSAIVSKVGGFEPFYAYQIESSVHASELLNVRKQVPTLHLVAEHNGPCEIGSLFLSPDHRGGGRGRLLSLSRFLFMADHREYFDPQVIAEMRGVIDEHGHSPFWEAIGRHFFEIEFPYADYLSIVNKRFIADLMPKHPIYIPLLPADAQAVIGQVHEKTAPARKLLESEAFAYRRMVDIFEAGPVLACDRDDIRTIKESDCGEIEAVVDEPIDSPTYLISNRLRDFRACQGPAAVTDQGGVQLTKEVADALGVGAGDSVRYVAARALTNSEALKHEKDRLHRPGHGRNDLVDQVR